MLVPRFFFLFRDYYYYFVLTRKHHYFRPTIIIMFAVLEKLTLLSHVPIQNNNNRTYRMLQDYYFPTGTITLPCPYNNNLARPERQHYYLDAWNETFVWLGFIIIISAFSGKIIIWTLEILNVYMNKKWERLFHAWSARDLLSFHLEGTRNCREGM